MPVPTPSRRSPTISRAALAFVALLVVAFVAWFTLRSTVGRTSAESPAAPSESSPLAHPAGSVLVPPSATSDARTSNVLDTTTTVPSADVDVHHLLVETVDSRGNALAGVHVSVIDVGGHGGGVFSLGTTDAQGRVSIEINTAEFADVRTMRVGTPCLTTTPAGVEFTADAWPAEPVRLVVGPSGSIELTFEWSEDYPLDADAYAYMYFDAERCGREPARGLHESNLGADITSRTFRFEHVGLDLCFGGGADSPGLDFDDVTFDGPRREGEVVRVNVPFVEARVRISGRLVDRDGTALAGHDIWLWTIADEQRDPLLLLEARSGRDGRFAGFVRSYEARRVSSRLTVRAERSGQIGLSGTATWSGMQASTIVDGYTTLALGDIVAEPEPRIALGRIIGPDGEPLSEWINAKIEMRPVDPGERVDWIATNTSVARDGTFQVGSRDAIPRFELRATAYGHVPSEPVAVSSADDPVELRLRAGGRVEGRLLVADDVDVEQMDLNFACVDPPASSDHRTNGCETYSDGRFVARSLAVGSYSVAVSHLGTELARRTFEIQAAGSILQLEPIDLREIVHPIRLQVVGSDGSAVDRGAVRLLIERTYALHAIDRNGRATVCALTRTIDVVVSAPGFTTQRFDAVASGALLELEPGIAVHVHVPNLPPAPPGWEYEVELDPTGDSLLAENSESVFAGLDASGQAVLRVPCTSEYTVSASLRRSGHRESSLFTALDDVRIEARAGEPVPTIVLEAGADDLRDVLEEIRAR